MGRFRPVYPVLGSIALLWTQSDGKQQDSFLQVRDELMGGLRQNGDVLRGRRQHSSELY